MCVYGCMCSTEAREPWTGSWNANTKIRFYYRTYYAISKLSPLWLCTVSRMSSYSTINTHESKRLRHPSFFFKGSYSPINRQAPNHFSFASSVLASELLPEIVIARFVDLPNGTPVSKRPDLDPRQLDFGRATSTAPAGPAAPVAAALAAPVDVAGTKRRAWIDGHAKPCNCKLDCLSKFSQREIDDRRWWLQYCLTDRKRHEACFHELITASTVISPGKRKVNPT